MNRTIRMSIALVVTFLLILSGVGVWAAPKLQGTVPPVPVTGEQTCPATIDMGTALFTCTAGVISMLRVGDPVGEYAPAPEGLAFVGDTFKATMMPDSELIKVCYAYPPEFADKDAKIYRLNDEANPPVWVEVPGAEIGDGTICVTSAMGVFSLIGNP